MQLKAETFQRVILRRNTILVKGIINQFEGKALSKVLSTKTSPVDLGDGSKSYNAIQTAIKKAETPKIVEVSSFFFLRF